ncbi:MAG: PAS domain-containing protein, partial [Kiritimatiellae bacterium]|nr:PAS domain-containing protein [Kiritimatiellia bacterium]
KSKLSQTMRIDLIPDIPAEPVTGQKRVVVSSSPTRKFIKPASRQDKSGEDVKYHALLQSVYDAAIISDFTGQIIDVNLRAVEFFSYSMDDFARLKVFDIVSGSDESLLKTLRENLENERFTLIQAYCIRSDGTYFPAEIAVNVLNLGEMRLCFFVRDITLRKQAEEMLRTEHNAIQNSGNGIAVADLDAKLEYANPAMAAMWGYGSAEMLHGMDARDLMSDKDVAKQMMNVVMSEQQTWVGEVKAHRNDGGEFDVQVSAACNRNSDGEVVGLVFSFVDISDHKKVEEALREAERQRVMLESLGAACHHLGQPATVLLANLGIMQKKLGDKDDLIIKELVSTSIDAAETLGDILHKLNTVNEYKTTRYLEGREGPDSDGNRILEI